MKLGSVTVLLLLVLAGLPAGAAESMLAEADERCLRCHEEEYAQYEEGIHASLRSQGNTEAPSCGNCHITHRVRGKPPYQAATGAPCSQCHGAIFQAYTSSVHSQVRVKNVDYEDEEDTHVMGCPDCHRFHDVTAASTSNQLKETCLDCHDNVLLEHQQWLPNTGLHFESVSCPACHAPMAQRKVDLRLYNSTTQEQIREKEGVPQFENRARSIDVEGKGLNALALQSLLKQFNLDEGQGDTILRGRLEVKSGAEYHQLADKSKAIRECERCHSKGSDPFQSVTISIARPDGRLLRYDAHQEVLSSAVSIDSVSGFYAIGATRMKLLDILLLLSVVGGISLPIGHMTMKVLVRKYLKRGEGQPEDKTRSVNDDRSDMK